MKMIDLKKLALGLLAAAMLASCTAPGAAPDSTGTDTDAQSVQGTDSQSAVDNSAYDFDYSTGINENGYFENIRALDYVTLPPYKGIEIAREDHEIPEADVKAQVDQLLSNFATTIQVTDRAVKDGDTVNIDYVGSVDGVEFEGGSTKGAGTNVTIGVTSYIDDFLEQLIGHMPGDTFDVNVTFPDPYQNNPDLAGKDAVFVTTVNYISENSLPELTDEFVEANLKEQYGWTTASDVTEYIINYMTRSKLMNYALDYLKTKSVISEIPEAILSWQKGTLTSYYASGATQYGYSLEDFLKQQGVESLDALYENYADQMNDDATVQLIIQAIAEDAGITATEADARAYITDTLSRNFDTDLENYGLNYLLQVTLTNMVYELISENAILK